LAFDAGRNKFGVWVEWVLWFKELKLHCS